MIIMIIHLEMMKMFCLCVGRGKCLTINQTENGLFSLFCFVWFYEINNNNNNNSNTSSTVVIVVMRTTLENDEREREEIKLERRGGRERISF
jgi:hypothetical protein